MKIKMTNEFDKATQSAIDLILKDGGISGSQAEFIEEVVREACDAAYMMGFEDGQDPATAADIKQ